MTTSFIKLIDWRRENFVCLRVVFRRLAPAVLLKRRGPGRLGANQRLWRAIIGENGGGAGRFLGAFSTPAAILIAAVTERRPE